MKMLIVVVLMAVSFAVPVTAESVNDKAGIGTFSPMRLEHSDVRGCGIRIQMGDEMKSTAHDATVNIFSDGRLMLKFASYTIKQGVPVQDKIYGAYLEVGGLRSPRTHQMESGLAVMYASDDWGIFEALLKTAIGNLATFESGTVPTENLRLAVLLRDTDSGYDGLYGPVTFTNKTELDSLMECVGWMQHGMKGGE